MAEALSDLAVIVLAAGASRRFSAGNKLLYLLEGEPLLSHVLAPLQPLPFMHRILVTNGTPEIEALAAEWGFTPLTNHQAAHGVGSSIATGVQALQSGTKGCFIALGDMPFVPSGIYNDLADQFTNAADICRPVWGHRDGHPVLFGADYFGQLAALNEDTGARIIIKANLAHLTRVPASSEGVYQDIDVAPQG